MGKNLSEAGAIGVTVYLTVVGTIVNLLFTTTMAFGLTRGIYGQRIVVLLVLFTVLFSAGMIPTYLVVKATGLLDSIWALILPSAIGSVTLIIIRQFFMSLPQELFEAAIMDGANDLQLFGRLALPLSKPALAAFGCSMPYRIGTRTLPASCT